MQKNINRTIMEFVLANFVYWGGAELLSETDSLLANGIIDSAGILELITFLETEFGITIEDQDVLPSNLDSVAAASDFVSRKLQGTTSSAVHVAAGTAV